MNICFQVAWIDQFDETDLYYPIGWSSMDVRSVVRTGDFYSYRVGVATGVPRSYLPDESMEWYHIHLVAPRSGYGS